MMLKRIEFVERLSDLKTIEQCVELFTNTVFDVTGYDRALCYKFLESWHGEVIYEKLQAGVTGYLGLRFPESDVPVNVRKLYTTNWQRIISNVSAETSNLVAWTDDNETLDMTHSMLRAVHPVHIKYLKNIGVNASFSLSIVVNGKLWGLMVCHHLSAKHLSVDERLALEEIARLVSLQLKNLTSMVEQHHEGVFKEKLSSLKGALQALKDDPKSALTLNLGKFKDMFDADGVWMSFDGDDYFAGMVPDLSSLMPLRNWLESLPKDKVSQYHELPESLMKYRAIVSNASGAMYIPLTTTDFILLLRREVVEVVNWASQVGNHEEGDPRALTPRNSFSSWMQEVRNTSEPWQALHTSFAQTLRDDIVEYVRVSKIEKLALRDSLTGLSNRLQFGKSLQKNIREILVNGGSFAVHMIDLDRFKLVNDTYGHAGGDELLVSVASRLKDMVGTYDTVARLGGDEFAVIQTSMKDRGDAETLAKEIVAKVSEPYDISGNMAEVGASIGVAIYPDDTSQEKELLENADLALYAVKGSGRNSYSLFHPHMKGAQGGSVNKDAILTAINGGEFGVNYQKMIDNRTLAIRGVDACVFWDHPEKGRLDECDFMADVERLRATPVLSLGF